MSSLTKTCECCGIEFPRPPKVGLKAWGERRFCNRRCKEKHVPPWSKGLTKDDHPSLMSASQKNSVGNLGKASWNKGLTKYDHPGLMAVSESMKKSQSGKVPWNKGLTKESNTIVAQYALKIGESQKGKKINKAQLRGLEKGRRWCAGLTKDDDPRLGERGQSVARALRGRINPEHSERMKEFYKQNPEKHPNAILARKSKGNGFTYIEKLLKEYLNEIGLQATFNYKIGSKWVDFALVNGKLAIEADGEFWHKDKEKEIGRDMYLQERGWGVLHLTGSDIVNDAMGCKQIILKHVEALNLCPLN